MIDMAWFCTACLCSTHRPQASAVGTLKEKMNKADTEACTAVAKDLSKQLQAAGVSQVQLDGAPKYHGRIKTFIDELRSNGIKC